MVAVKPGGIGRLKPPAPVYRPCVLCGRKHRMRPDGTSKTAVIVPEGVTVLLMRNPVRDERSEIHYQNIPAPPAGALICPAYCRP